MQSLRSLKRRFVPSINAGADVPLTNQTTYVEPHNQWFYPALAGPATFLPQVSGSHAVERALSILEQLTPDTYSEFVVNYYGKGLANFGERWVYADINTVLVGLARSLNVRDYLEIGVRRGRSMAMVAAQAPECSIVGFDLWVENYAGMDNPGKAFVESELRRIGMSGRLEFVDGDSRHTVPAYFRDHTDRFFDLITVDGDHSFEGARRDLGNVIPRLKVGGALVFDDVSNQDHRHLAKVWRDVVARDTRFASYVFDEVGFGIAFAIRKR